MAFDGRVEHRNSRYALSAAACMRVGQPDVLSDAGWWQVPVAMAEGAATVANSPTVDE